MSLKGLCVLVGRDIGLRVIEKVGVLFLTLFDEYILRAFLVFNMKNSGYFKLLRECSVYLNSSSRYCGLHIQSAR